MTMQKKPIESGADDSWAEDQREREYYYDDAHGYEDFDPDALEDEEEGEKGGQGEGEKLDES